MLKAEDIRVAMNYMYMPNTKMPKYVCTRHHTSFCLSICL